ncbi:MAG: hypothetical protein JO048_18025 [Methylobacteriaceae bacterium]|nr:hypothetical protein [Methylobacteriaceae bacterium]
MRALGTFLTRCGRHGPTLLVLSLAIGIAAPPAAELAHRGLPLAAFLLTLGSLLTALFAPAEPGTGPRLVLLALAWAGLAVPTLIALATRALPLGPDLQAGIVLAALAPPTGSAAAVAAMLDLRPRLALVVSIGLTLMAPLSIPICAHLVGLDATFDTARLALQLALIVGGSTAVALTIRQARGAFASVLPDTKAASGVAVLGLMLVGLAMADGVRAQWEASVPDFLAMLAVAVTLNAGLTALGALVFAASGWRSALTAGIVGGNRNVTLAWAAAAGGALPMAAEGYVAAAVIPILALPLAIRAGLRVGRLATSIRARGFRTSPALVRVSALALLALGSGGTAAGPLAGNCQLDPRDQCRCSLSSIETAMTFGDAASLIEVYGRDDPDGGYGTLLSDMLRQCLAGLPSPPASSATLRPIPVLSQPSAPGEIAARRR